MLKKHLVYQHGQPVFLTIRLFNNYRIRCFFQLSFAVWNEPLFSNQVQQFARDLFSTVTLCVIFGEKVIN